MNSNAKYLIAAVIIVIGVIGISFYSCEKEEIVPNETTPILMDPNQQVGEGGITGNELKGEPDLNQQTGEGAAVVGNDLKGEPYMPEIGENCGKVYSSRIVAANETVGNIAMYNDGKTYVVVLSASRGWYFGRAFSHIGYSLSDFPLDNLGNPHLSEYDYFEKDPKQKKVIEFKIPLSEISKNKFLNSVACEVTSDPQRPGKRMIAWVEGESFGATMPGTAFVYKKQPCLATDAGSDQAGE